MTSKKCTKKRDARAKLLSLPISYCFFPVLVAVTFVSCLSSLLLWNWFLVLDAWSDAKVEQSLDCKTVRIFAYSSTREQLNKRCGTRLKTESETTGLRACEARAVRAHKSLTPRVTDFFTDFEEKTDCFAV